jgi:hypothetical protein
VFSQILNDRILFHATSPRVSFSLPSVLATMGLEHFLLKERQCAINHLHGMSHRRLRQHEPERHDGFPRLACGQHVGLGRRQKDDI